MNLGLPELLVIFMVALWFLGPKSSRSLQKAMGEGIRDFKKALKEDDSTPPQLPPSTPQTPSQA